MLRAVGARNNVQVPAPAASRCVYPHNRTDRSSARPAPSCALHARLVRHAGVGIGLSAHLRDAGARWALRGEGPVHRARAWAT